MNIIHELEKKFKQLMEQAVYDCATDEAGHKVKRFNQCMQNMGIKVGYEVLCLKNIENYE